MIWPLGQRDVTSLPLEPLTTDHARALADCHAGLFHRSWTDGEFYDLLSRQNVSGFGLFKNAEPNAPLAGFIILQSAADEVEILTVAVSPSFQGKGAGSRLVDQALRAAYQSGASSVFLEVSEENAPAVALYRKLGFLEVANRKGYYPGLAPGTRASAIVMRRDVR